MAGVNAPTNQRRDPLRARAGALLEAALNRALALDPASAERLALLEGRRVGIELRGIDLALGVGVRDRRLHVEPADAAAPDLRLRASPAALLAFAVRAEGATLPPGRVEISGDAELARTLERLLRGFRPDLEEACARVFGDVFGVPLARALARGFAWSRETARTLAENAADYLREESRELVAPAELERFLDEVDVLRERVERLEARLAGLARRARGDAA
jgi:ubiquinone biosynthesis protein UbiJ